MPTKANERGNPENYIVQQKKALLDGSERGWIYMSGSWVAFYNELLISDLSEDLDSK